MHNIIISIHSLKLKVVLQTCSFNDCPSTPQKLHKCMKKSRHPNKKTVQMTTSCASMIISAAFRYKVWSKVIIVGRKTVLHGKVVKMSNVDRIHDLVHIDHRQEFGQQLPRMLAPLMQGVPHSLILENCDLQLNQIWVESYRIFTIQRSWQPSYICHLGIRCYVKDHRHFLMVLMHRRPRGHGDVYDEELSGWGSREADCVWYL